VVPKRYLFFVNPFGGTKKAMRIFTDQVEPLLKVSVIDYNVVITERRNHAFEYVRDMSLENIHAVVTVSGDGLVHEVLNGLMARQDWKEAMKIALGTIPSGTGNALAMQACGTMDITTNTYHALKGRKQPLDILVCKQEGKTPLYSFLEMFWGLLADIDIESERLVPPLIPRIGLRWYYF
jgi:sphingosine kinase